MSQKLYSPNQYNENPDVFIQSVRQIVSNKMMKMYGTGMSACINRLGDWSDTVARANDDGHVTNMTTMKDMSDDCIWTRADSLVKTLGVANESWRPWAAIGNSICQNLAFISNVDDFEIVSPDSMYTFVNIRITEISNEFEHANIKTDNNNDNWKYYYTALESLTSEKVITDRKPATTRKAKTSAKSRPKRSRSSSETIDSVDRRKSSRLSIKPQKSFMEHSDPESQDEGATPTKRSMEMMEFQDSPVSLVKRSREF